MGWPLCRDHTTPPVSSLYGRGTRERVGRCRGNDDRGRARSSQPLYRRPGRAARCRLHAGRGGRTWRSEGSSIRFDPRGAHAMAPWRDQRSAEDCERVLVRCAQVLAPQCSRALGAARPSCAPASFVGRLRPRQRASPPLRARPSRRLTPTCLVAPPTRGARTTGSTLHPYRQR